MTYEDSLQSHFLERETL